MSYLAAPPESLIDIDGAVEYQYVIAQQNATKITVTPDVDFTFAVTGGSPALLRLKFTGATSTVPIYKTVTITLEVPEGTLTDSPRFRILPTFGSQRIPNITNPRSLSVAPGATVNMTISTDIAATSFAAAGLPGTLGINSAGRITGTAPAGSWNLVTLTATAGAYHYKRYFILIVGSGTVNSEPFFAFSPDILP